MKINKAKVLYLSLIVIFLATIFTCIYYLLGGFNDPELYLGGRVQRTVFGKHFEDARSDAFAKHGSKCRDIIESGQVRGRLTLIIYPKDTIRNAELDRFVGITSEEEMLQIPGDFEIREYEFDQRIVLELKDMHLIVQPRPDKIESRIREFAQKRGLKLADFYLVHYGQEHSDTLFEWPVLN